MVVPAVVVPPHAAPTGPLRVPAYAETDPKNNTTDVNSCFHFMAITLLGVNRGDGNGPKPNTEHADTHIIQNHLFAAYSGLIISPCPRLNTYGGRFVNLLAYSTQRRRLSSCVSVFRFIHRNCCWCGSRSHREVRSAKRTSKRRSRVVAIFPNDAAITQSLNSSQPAS